MAAALGRVKARGRRAARGVLEHKADVHPAARGITPHDLFQPRLQAAQSGGQTPFEVQVAAVDAFYFPLLGEKGAFHHTAAKPGHTAKHGDPSCI